STLQYSGAAGVMVAAGVGPRSATASALGAINVAESIVAPLLARPIFEASIGAASVAHPAWASAPGRNTLGLEQAASTTGTPANSHSFTRIVVSKLSRCRCRGFALAAGFFGPIQPHRVVHQQTALQFGRGGNVRDEVDQQPVVG